MRTHDHLPLTFQESLRDALAFDSRDWSLNRRDAWIWGIVHGWPSDDPTIGGDAMAEVAEQHGWDADAVARLRMLHEQFNASEAQA